MLENLTKDVSNNILKYIGDKKGFLIETKTKSIPNIKKEIETASRGGEKKFLIEYLFPLK